MRESLRILMVGLLLTSAVPVPAVQAAAPSRELARTQVPSKPETCKPRWPYVMLTCVA